MAADPTPLRYVQTTQPTFVNSPVLFGIFTQDQVEQVMQQSPVWLLPSNTSLSSVQMSPEVSLAMASSEVSLPFSKRLNELIM